MNTAMDLNDCSEKQLKLLRIFLTANLRKHRKSITKPQKLENQSFSQSKSKFIFGSLQASLCPVILDNAATIIQCSGIRHIFLSLLVSSSRVIECLIPTMCARYTLIIIIVFILMYSECKYVLPEALLPVFHYLSPPRLVLRSLQLICINR
jgi:hypothetical protein